MTKAVLLFALISLSLCFNPVQFLDSKTHGDETKEMRLALRGFIEGIQIFKGIPCPERCDITPQEAGVFNYNIKLLLEAFFESLFKPSASGAVKLRTGLMGLAQLALSLTGKCSDAAPAFNARVDKAIAHMTNFQYIISLTYRVEENFNKWNDGMNNIMYHCMEDFTACGVKFGNLVHDVLFWNFE
jgi:hypothetical protein